MKLQSLYSGYTVEGATRRQENMESIPYNRVRLGVLLSFFVLQPRGVSCSDSPGHFTEEA